MNMTLSNEYQKLLIDMHSTNKKWGSEFKKTPMPVMLKNTIDKYKPKSILDFGCGKGFLSKKIRQEYPEITVTGWDPSHNDELTGTYDMIISTDVLEHVEPEYLKSTLADLKKRANIVQYHLIACYSAAAILPDGRNAHLSILTPDEWQGLFLDNDYKIINENVNCTWRNKKGKSAFVGKKIALEYEIVAES